MLASSRKQLVLASKRLPVVNRPLELRSEKRERSIVLALVHRSVHKMCCIRRRHQYRRPLPHVVSEFDL